MSLTKIQFTAYQRDEYSMEIEVTPEDLAFLEANKGNDEALDQWFNEVDFFTQGDQTMKGHLEQVTFTIKD